MPRIIASIEARMGSSRLPGKSLMDIEGKPAMTRLINRLRKSEFLQDIVLATTTTSTDDRLETWAKNENVICYRGSEEDVLARVVEAHRVMETDIIVEITGDCILLDPVILDMGIQTFLENDCDVVTNTQKLSFPMGVDIQVFLYSDLEHVANTTMDPAVREHVSLYFYEHPDIYRIIHLFAPRQWCAPTYRFQLDYLDDHRFISEIYKRLEPDYGENFGINEIMTLLCREPDLVEINIHCEEKPVR